MTNHLSEKNKMKKQTIKLGLIAWLVLIDVTFAFVGMNKGVSLFVLVGVIVYLSVENTHLWCKREVTQSSFDIDSFFAMGGYAYCWNEGERKKKCKSYADLLSRNAHYVEFWLNGERYIVNRTPDSNKVNTEFETDYLQKIANENRF